MILVDANLLIYAQVVGLPEHEAAARWLERQFNEQPRVGLPWASLLTFIRIVSNPRVFERPLRLRSAWSHVSEWLSLKSVWIPQPTERHPSLLGSLLTEGGERANLVPDAHLAALALEHGLTLCSTDGDFARFSKLRWENPLR